MKNTKKTFKISNLLLSTPKFWRKIGNTFLAVSIFVGGFSLYEGEKWISMISFGCGILGTIITNMVTEENLN